MLINSSPLALTVLLAASGLSKTNGSLTPTSSPTSSSSFVSSSTTTSSSFSPKMVNDTPSWNECDYYDYYDADNAWGECRTNHDDFRNKYYKQYPKYPEYCSTQEHMDNRKIPPLNSSLRAYNIKLRHVTAVSRHGARTPTSYNECWDGYRDDISLTGDQTWYCQMHSLSATPAAAAMAFEHMISTQDPAQIADYEGEVSRTEGEGAMFLYEKSYNAHFSPSDPNHFPANMGNHLPGTCQLGQMILRGYDQDVANGLYLRERYVYDEINNVNKDTDNKNLLLYDFTISPTHDGTVSPGKRAYEYPQVYFRSDDTARNIMSGQVLMRGLFGGLLETHLNLEQGLSGYINNLPVVRVFTTDEDNDVLKPNYKICPKLKQLEDTARSSKAFKAISEEDDVLETLIEEGLLADDMKDPDIGMDCIMTTICTDRTLPSILDDYGRGPMTDDIQTKGSDFFERVVSRLEKEKIFIHQYDSARYAKLASYPLWSEILPRLLVHTKIDTQDLMSHWPDTPDTPSKFALYSTHADTIITLLASLQINVDQWPPYGSMLIIELYELDLTDEEYDEVRETYPTKTAFRMIYNGEVITPKVFACPQDDELCDIDLLVLHVYKDSDISTWGNECLVGGDDDDLDLTEKTPIDDDQQDNINRGNQTRIGAAGAVLSVMTGVIGIIIGIMISSTYLNRSSSNEETVKFDVDMNEEARIYGLERGNSGMNVETAVVA